MAPATRRFGKTELTLNPLGLGGFAFGAVNRARDWNPYERGGRAFALATINYALDAGINYIDTAPGYGDGHSESLIGEVMSTRRGECVLATKVPWQGLDRDAVLASIRSSLRRLRTDHVDVVQIHGGVFTPDDEHHLLTQGPLAALQQLRDEGAIGFIGLTVEEPHSALNLIASGHFDTVQLAYNLIYQGAALHALPATQQHDLGVAVMRPMTSGILQRLIADLAPNCGADLYGLCLRFVLADRRVHVANVGMRWPHEIDRNLAIAEAAAEAPNTATLPRSTAGIYQLEDDATALS
jgi:aryl-alcohol dehydrogenase-like predicted oxidoreductase